MNHEVYFILDRRFRGDLRALTRAGRVWLVDSPENGIAARAIGDGGRGDEVAPWCGLTTFPGSEDLEHDFYVYLVEIDIHHNSEHEHSRPWDTIHVIGVPSSRFAPERIAEELGLDGIVVESEPGGLAIRRPTAD